MGMARRTQRYRESKGVTWMRQIWPVEGYIETPIVIYLYPTPGEVQVISSEDMDEDGNCIEKVLIGTNSQTLEIIFEKGRTIFCGTFHIEIDPQD